MGVDMTVSKKIMGAVGAAALSLGALTATAHAEDKLNYTWTVTGASDYLFRGISYTQNDPTVNSYLEFTYNIFYLGFWTSNIDTCTGKGCAGFAKPWEQDIYFGIRPTTGPINWDIAAFWYIYGVNQGDPWDLDYVEFKIGATYSPVTNLTLGANVFLTPDQGVASTENISVEGTVSYALPKIAMFDPTLSATIGYSDSGTNKFYTTGYWLGQQNYTYWNAGVKLSVEKFFMDLRYWDTSIDANTADARFLFSAGVALP